MTPADAGYAAGLACPPLTQAQADWAAALLASIPEKRNAA